MARLLIAEGDDWIDTRRSPRRNQSQRQGDYRHRSAAWSLTQLSGPVGYVLPKRFHFSTSLVVQSDHRINIGSAAGG
jgi:hypothetical protein